MLTNYAKLTSMKSCTNLYSWIINKYGFLLHSVFVLIRPVHFDFILSVLLNLSVLHVHAISALFILLGLHCCWFL